jgi:hypothetical protein
MKTSPKALPIPAPALADPAAVELARVWVAGGDQHVSLAVGVWEDPAAWGIMLVDLARHVAQAYAQDQGGDVDQILSRVREGFDAEWPS